MGIWSRVGAVVALLALPLALAVGSQALADRPGPPAMPDQPVELVETDPVRQPSAQPSDPPPSDPPPSGPARDGGPRVVTPSPSVPLDDDVDDADDDADEDAVAGDGDD